jgi:hypothetical protein
MKLTGYQIDWKDEFEDNVVEELIASLGSERTYTAEHDVSGHVDARLLIISDELLDRYSLSQVWEAGDLGVADKVYEGTFDEIIEQLRQNLADNE